MPQNIFNLMICYEFTYLFKLFGDIGWVIPEFSSEAFSQDQRVEQSWKASFRCMTQELRQAWNYRNHNYTERLLGSGLFICSPRFMQHTFTDSHPVSEDPCCVLGKSKLLNGDGAQLCLNQAKTKYLKHYSEDNERKNNHPERARKHLPIYFHLCCLDLPLKGKPGKTHNDFFQEKKYIIPHCKTGDDVISDLMVSLFLSLFNVFKVLFSFTLSWMSLNSLLFDTNSIYRYSCFLSEYYCHQHPNN